MLNESGSDDDFAAADDGVGEHDDWDDGDGCMLMTASSQPMRSYANVDCCYGCRC